MKQLINCIYCNKQYSKFGIKNHISIVHLKLRKVDHNKGKKLKTCWNKNKTYEEIFGKDIADAYKNKISNSLIGKIGHKLTDKEKENLRFHAIKNNFGGHNSKKSIYYKCKDNCIVYLQSSYEEKLAIILDEHNIRWNRPEPLKWYDDENIFHRYYPDFYLIDYNIYLDPKNDYLIQKDKIKIEKVSIQNNIKIIILTDLQLTFDFINSLMKVKK